MNQRETRREFVRTVLAAGGCALCSGAGMAADRPARFPGRLPTVEPDEIRVDPRQLRVAYDLMEGWTAGPNAPVPIRRDAMFYMASITKPVIYMAAMLLVERGRLNLSDPVQRYIPEFDGQWKDVVQVLHLFTHTSGLPDELPNNTELRQQRAPLRTFIEGSVRADLLFRPGTRQSYSSSATILVAEIIQQLSGRSIHEFIRREIAEPLGLQSTGLGSQGFARERLVRATLPQYQVGIEGHWNSRYWQEFGSPAGGLFSTPEDFAVICALILNAGRWGDLQLLSPATVRMMTSNRLNDLPNLPEQVRRTQPWGLGWRLNHLGMADSWGDLLDRNVFGHTGLRG